DRRPVKWKCRMPSGPSNVHLLEENTNMLSLNDENFEQEVMQSDVPVLVDFWAEWCGPCRMLTPLIEQLSSSYDGRAKVAKLNVDEAQQLAMKYNVRSIPTVILFKDGQVQDTFVGIKKQADYEKGLDALLA
ncbi:MAG: thioredoxin, partial [Pseudomonadota bacterium]